ncbi:MAG: zeta toxin family protein [Planctomycetes bacterium]|nr:zeta toxin family protein [Planctomycetota bacterium]
MLAGPNGSGKTTLKEMVVRELPPNALGIDLNPDEIENKIRESGQLDLRTFGLEPGGVDPAEFLSNHALLIEKGMDESAQLIGSENCVLDFSRVEVNSYIASATVSFVREQLLKQHVSFAIETVMSSPDKVELLERAQKAGFRTYLYYIATKDPGLNVQRVAQRVAQGGHDVPDDKIVSRYSRSLDLLAGAISHTNRAYIFDNSGDKPRRIAEITEGRSIHLEVQTGPEWFETFVLERLNLRQE